MTPILGPPLEGLLLPHPSCTVDFIPTCTCAGSGARHRGRLACRPGHTRRRPLLLGDIFEVWVGDDAIHDPGSLRARCAPSSGRRTLPALYFMHGNRRDFLAGSAFLQHCGITGLQDPTVLSLAGQRYLLSHGDLLCVDDVDYQRFRVQARSPPGSKQFCRNRSLYAPHRRVAFRQK